jgi:integrase
VFLKVSLGTKSLKEANVRAKLVLADFDRTLREAEALLAQSKQITPLRTTLNDAEIKRMAEYVYAKTLAWDERVRFGRDEWRRMEDEHNRLEGRTMESWAVPFDQLPPHGFSPTILAEQRAQLSEDLRDMRERLALGDIAAVDDHTIEALSAFGIDLDRKSSAYPKLGIEVLRAYVRALQDIEKRNAGEPIPTPAALAAPNAVASGTLREAFEGWKKERERPEGTVHEYGRAIEMFISFIGNFALLEIRRSHVLRFREALQLVPTMQHRKGTLRTASLDELADYGRKHPSVPKVSAGTVNKQLGAVQAIAGWGYHTGLVPDDAQWLDPFKDMRLEEEQSTRAPFDTQDLQTIFNDPLFTKHELPEGAGGEAGVWLPLLALFAGARQAEVAGLRVFDISVDASTRVPLIRIVADRKAGRSLKNKSSERVVPVHPQLVKLGFLKYVEQRRRDGERAWVFPTVAPDQRGALSAWSKWHGRYLRGPLGITDTDKVFHSWRRLGRSLRRTVPRLSLYGHPVAL